MTTLIPLHDIEGTAVEQLLDKAFGPDRHGRTAYRIRQGMAPLAELSFAAVNQDMVLGTLQSWPIALHCDSGGLVPMVMVGPVAVDPDRQGDGIGRQLMTRMIAAAEATGDARALMLIGDPAYYGRFFRFSAERTALWRAPGPVEQHRLLARGPAVPADAGLLGPREAAIA